MNQKPGPKGDKPAHLRAVTASISMPQERWEAIDKQRGTLSRSRFIYLKLTNLKTSKTEKH